jgi:hypothetical protein
MASLAFNTQVSFLYIQFIHYVDIAIVLLFGRHCQTLKKRQTINDTLLYFIQINSSMQIATLNYHYNPKNNFHSNSKSKFQLRHIVTTIKSPEKKPKQRRAYEPNISINSNASLPLIKATSKRPNSIRIKGNGIISSKFNDSSTYSFHQLPRSNSRQSNKSDVSGTRSRSVCIDLY